MNVNDALKLIEKGNKVRSSLDGKGIFYTIFNGDKVGRLYYSCSCGADVIKIWSKQDFLNAHSSINFFLLENESQKGCISCGF